MPYRAVAAAGLAAGLLLFVSLFVEWWSPGVSGWSAFEVLDLVMAAAAVYAVGACAAAALGDGWPREARVLPLVGGLAFLIILVQILDPPPSVPDDTSLSTGPGSRCSAPPGSRRQASPSRATWGRPSAPTCAASTGASEPRRSPRLVDLSASSGR